MLVLDFDPFPLLSTENLLLRNITKYDVEAIFFLRSNEACMRYISRPLAKSVNDSLQWIQLIDDLLKTADAICWGISQKNKNKLIGTITLWRIDKANHRAEIGYMLHPDFHGKGIMQQAVNAVIDYGFKTMKLHSVEGSVDPRNTASFKVLERSGFVKEAYFKECIFYSGMFLDTVIYSLLTPV